MYLGVFHLYMLALALVKAASDCGDGYDLCSPPGATSSTTPQIGTLDFRNLFIDITKSSLPSSKRSTGGSASLCCEPTMSCLSMNGLGIPFCYDRFTTNYFLPDGSYGTVVGGAYTSSVGDTANLETGEYMLANGEKGNIYPDGKLDTATLPMPSQFTGTGVGPPIPPNSLGRQITITYTTTLPGITKPGTTIFPSTIFSVVEEPNLLPATNPTSLAATITLLRLTTSVVLVGTTVDGTTVVGVVTTVTTIELVASVSSSATKTGDAGRISPPHWMSLILEVFKSLYVLRN